MNFDLFSFLQIGICSVYQKSAERLERLSLALHIFRIISKRLFNILPEMTSFESFDDKFKLICANQELTDDEHAIDYETCFRASILTKFYLNQTKILAGYDPITDNVLGNKKCTIIITRLTLSFFSLNDKEEHR